MGAHEKKVRAERYFEDKDGLAPRLNELIRLFRWSFYLLIAICAMVSLFFFREAFMAILSLFGG